MRFTGTIGSLLKLWGTMDPSTAVEVEVRVVDGDKELQDGTSGPLLPPGEAGRFLGFRNRHPDESMRRLARLGKIPAVRRNGRLLFNRQDLVYYARRGNGGS